ncbi:response regulator [Pollutibacter soli]|uniref:response regulator n=1 Tax=Pollutibacter soli TaxID=3034157 RepID=UPI0030138262
MKSGPIILIEDDEDDKEIFQTCLAELIVTNKLIWFNNCAEAFHYLKTTSEQPFIIFSDVNLQKITGIEFKRQIDSDPQLRRKSIPFIFYSTSVSQDTVDKAYIELSVQGFFQKKSSFLEVKNSIHMILRYWSECRHPNTR